MNWRLFLVLWLAGITAALADGAPGGRQAAAG